MKEMVLMGTLRNSLQRFQRLTLPDTIFILQKQHFSEVSATFTCTNLAENNCFFIFTLELIITQKA